MASGEKKKRKKIKMPGKRVPFDPMDDLAREQVKPREEPLEADQDEPWDSKWEWDGDENTRTGGSRWSGKNNGEE